MCSGFADTHRCFPFQMVAQVGHRAGPPRSGRCKAPRSPGLLGGRRRRGSCFCPRGALPRRYPPRLGTVRYSVVKIAQQGPPTMCEHPARPLRSQLRWRRGTEAQKTRRLDKIDLYGAVCASRTRQLPARICPQLPSRNRARQLSTLTHTPCVLFQMSVSARARCEFFCAVRRCAHFGHNSRYQRRGRSRTERANIVTSLNLPAHDFTPVFRTHQATAPPCAKRKWFLLVLTFEPITECAARHAQSDTFRSLGRSSALQVACFEVSPLACHFQLVA